MEERNIEKEVIKINFIIMIIISITIICNWSVQGLYVKKFIIMLSCMLVGIVLSTIARLYKKIKLSNIIYIISLVCILLFCGISFLCKKHSENYNNQFMKYIYWKKFEINAQLDMGGYVSNKVEEIIKSAIQNNIEKNEKITIEYKMKNYNSVEELQELLNSINLNQNYNVSIEYNEKNNRIKHIILEEYMPYFLKNNVYIDGRKIKTVDEVLRNDSRMDLLY